MIRSMPKADRSRLRHFARRQWRARFIPVWILNVEGYGRSLVIARRMETRWSDSQHRRLWRVPAPVLGQLIRGTR